MEANLQCPLDPFVMGPLEKKMNLARVLEIENHVSSSSCHHPPLKDIVLHGNLDGSTPLLLACEQGDLNAVRHIVDVWGADVRDAGNFYHALPRKSYFYPDREKVRGATPIFVAALNDHIDIVRYLIGKNADVNAITSGYYQIYGTLYEDVSPLQVALKKRKQREEMSFQEFHMEKNVIARLLLEAGANPSALDSDGNPLWYKRGVYSIIELIRHGINLDLRSTKGDTILHAWITLASLNLDIIDKKKLFVDGVDLLLARGIDLTAQNKKGFTPILAAADQLKSPSGTLLCILDVLLKNDGIDATEKIDAMELAGARLLLALKPGRAFHYWKKALRLREKENINKILLQARGQVAEWETSQQLEEVIQDKSVHWIQAMLAGLRIHASNGLEAVVAFMDDLPFMSGIGYYAHLDVRKVKKAATMTQILDFCLEILGVFLLFDPYDLKLSDYRYAITRELTEKLLEPFFSTLGKSNLLLNVESEKIKLFLQLIVAGDPDGMSIRFEHDYQFFGMLADVPDLLLDEDIRKYLSASARQYEGALLSKAYDYEDWETLRFLLHLRADPDATVTEWVGHGNKLLHLAAGGMALTGDELEEGRFVKPAHLLFVYGAQPHLKNDEGKTAVDIWIQKNCGVEGMQSPKWKNRPYWCRNTIPKLGCLVAKTIHTNGIPYSRRPGDLPVELLTFLDNN